MRRFSIILDELLVVLLVLLITAPLTVLINKLLWNNVPASAFKEMEGYVVDIQPQQLKIFEIAEITCSKPPIKVVVMCRENWLKKTIKEGKAMIDLNDIIKQSGCSGTPTITIECKGKMQVLLKRKLPNLKEVAALSSISICGLILLIYLYFREVRLKT